MHAVLVRVAVDQAYGKWNGPVDPTTNEFVYVSIPGTNEFEPGPVTPYALVAPALATFAASRDSEIDLNLPAALSTGNMHLDPDFRYLSYGDKQPRVRDLEHLDPGDLVVFYSGLKPCRRCEHRLVYAIIGMFRVAEIVRVCDVPEQRWHENAHTRRLKRRPDDVIVRAQPGMSGRLATCMPIGEWRAGAYRVRTDLLQAWGGLSCKDGFIQRSAVPPRFLDPARFFRWFESQKPVLVAENNPTSSVPAKAKAVAPTT